jgi:acyl-CoA thioesterase II
MGAFRDDTVVASADGKLTATLSRDWDIWGPNGGYIAAIALRAIGKVAPADHKPATFSCQYLAAGQFDPVDIVVEFVRQGRNAWCLNAVLMQNGKRVLQAQAWTTNKTDGPRKVDRKMPDVPGPAGLKTWRELNPQEDGHPFWAHFDSKPVRLVTWKEYDERGSVLEEWYRFKDFPHTDDVWLDNARALLLVDTIQWPSWHRGLKEKPNYIAPSLDVTVWFHERPGSAEWLLGHARADVAGGGLIHGNVHIWSEDGRLIASGGSSLLHVASRG